MTAETTLDLTKYYKTTLNDLKVRIVQEIGDKLDSIILYGSAARNVITQKGK